MSMVLTALIYLCTLFACAYCYGDLNILRVSDLKQILKMKGLPQNGLKADLIARLTEAEGQTLTHVLGTEDRPKFAHSLRSRLVKKGKEKASTIMHTDENAMIESDTIEKEIRDASSYLDDLDEVDRLIELGDQYLMSREKKEHETASGAVNRGRNGGSASSSSMTAGTTEAEVAADGGRAITSASGMPEMDEDYYKVVKLMEARAKARTNKDYDEADRIRDDIEALGVEIFDRAGKWKDSRGNVWRFTAIPKAPKPANVETSLSQDEVQDLVNRRTMLRRGRNFQAADAIRDELATHGVEFSDENNAWATVDGKMKGPQSFDYSPPGNNSNYDDDDYEM
jgi:cysteinyl-tRNA synthetase